MVSHKNNIALGRILTYYLDEQNHSFPIAFRSSSTAFPQSLLLSVQKATYFAEVYVYNHWKKFGDWEKKWSKEFKQLWKEISPTAEKLFFQIRAFPKKDDRANKEEAKIKMGDLFGKIISYCLTRPSHLDIAGLATVSLEESEPLDKILRKTKRKILEQKQ